MTDTASAALLKDHDKAIALLKSLATECDTSGEDHAWRRCRSCLAKEELDHRGVKSMLRSFLAVLASLPAPAAPADICGAVGDPPIGEHVGPLSCELLKGHDGYHRSGGITWLGYHVAAQAPAPAAPPVARTPDGLRDALGPWCRLCAECGGYGHVSAPAPAAPRGTDRAEDKTPLPPDVLADALQDRIAPTSGRLRDAVAVKLAAPAAPCGAKHDSTHAVCELPVGHAQNHRGPFAHGIAQWPQPAPCGAWLDGEDEIHHCVLKQGHRGKHTRSAPVAPEEEK